MRALLEEYGYTIIAVFAATVMITVIIFSGIIPIMNKYTAEAIPEEPVKNAASKEALEESLGRAAPIITAEDTIILTQGSSVNFKECVSQKIITAINADGTDISTNIVFKASDANSAKHFDSNTGVFRGVNKGTYEVTLSVVDFIDGQFFGKTSQKTIKIIVQ